MTFTSGFPAYAVPADARDHALDETTRSGIAGITEAERVQERNGPRAHGEDVPENPAHAGGRTLERLDERRMIVAFDLEHHRPAVADVDGTGVLAGPLEHGGTALREPTQKGPRMLVGAVLGPQRGEETQLSVRGRPIQAGDDLLVLVGRQPELSRELDGDGRRSHRGDG
jgi:hypothetical protein